MAQAKGVQLLDLNHAPVKKLVRSDCQVFPSMQLPEILFDSFVISLAMLKAHSLAEVTLSMKKYARLCTTSLLSAGRALEKVRFPCPYA